MSIAVMHMSSVSHKPRSIEVVEVDLYPNFTDSNFGSKFCFFKFTELEPSKKWLLC